MRITQLRIEASKFAQFQFKPWLYNNSLCDWENPSPFVSLGPRELAPRGVAVKTLVEAPEIIQVVCCLSEVSWDVVYGK